MKSDILCFFSLSLVVGWVGGCCLMGELYVEGLGRKRGELETGELWGWELLDRRVGTHMLYRAGMTMLVHKALLACSKMLCTGT